MRPTRRAEALQLSLRTREGVPADALPGWADDPVLADSGRAGSGPAG